MFKRINILSLDDDEDDCMLIKDAISSVCLECECKCLSTANDLLDYLHQRNAYADLECESLPDLILIDLNMPGMNGLELLKIIKTDQALKTIPTLILTTSDSEIDILMSYQFGANSYIKKPVTYETLVDKLKTLVKYWFYVAKVPTGKCLKTSADNQVR